MAERFELPNKLGGRNLYIKVIPTVCNLKNMLTKLVQVNGDFSQLKQWEKRSYKAYKIEEIENEILNSPEAGWKGIIRKNEFGLESKHSPYGDYERYSYFFKDRHMDQKRSQVFREIRELKNGGIAGYIYINHLRERGVSA